MHTHTQHTTVHTHTHNTHRMHTHRSNIQIVPEVIDREYSNTGDVRVVSLAYVLHQLLTPLRGLHVAAETAATAETAAAAAA